MKKIFFLTMFIIVITFFGVKKIEASSCDGGDGPCQYGVAKDCSPPCGQGELCCNDSPPAATNTSIPCQTKKFTNVITGSSVTLNYGQKSFIDGCKACGWGKCCDGSGGQPVGKLQVQYDGPDCSADIVCVAVGSCDGGGGGPTSTPAVTFAAPTSTTPSSITCNSWSSFYINSCNSWAKYSSSPRDSGCLTSSSTVNLNMQIVGATEFRLANVTASTVCSSVADSAFSSPTPYSAGPHSWNVGAGTGEKKVCVRVSNGSNYGKCGGMIEVRPPVGPTLTIPAGCSLKTSGDANCNGKIEDADFGIWQTEFNTVGGGAKTADFNLDQKVDLIDFEIWRSNAYKSFILPTHGFIGPPKAPTSTPIMLPVTSVPSPTTSAGDIGPQRNTCQCDIGTVVKNDCISGYLPKCIGAFGCNCESKEAMPPINASPTKGSVIDSVKTVN